MKRLITLLLLLVFIVINSACEKQVIFGDSIETNLSDSKPTVERVSFGELGNVINSSNLQSKTGVFDFLKGKSNSKIYIDTLDVLQRVDSVGNRSFSMTVYPGDEDPKTLYNLIICDRVDGHEVQPFFIKYYFNEGDKFDFALDKNKVLNGTVDIISFDSFIDAYSLSSRGDNDLEPCPNYDDIGVNNYVLADGEGSFGGNGSGNSGGSNGNGSSATTGGGFSNTGGIIWSNTGSGSGSVEVGVGTFHTFNTDGDFDEKQNTILGKGGGDCPDVDIELPINEQDFEILCGTYDFKQIGDSFQANIGGLGVRFAEVHSDGTIIERNVYITNACIGVPANWTTTRYLSVYFPDIYNAALAELQVLMFTSGTYWSDTAIRDTLIGLIAQNINSHFFDAFELGTGVGYATPTSCTGAPYNEAKWCR